MDNIIQSVKEISIKEFDEIETTCVTETAKEFDEKHKKPDCAYVCLVMKGDLYVPGAIVVAHSIRETDTKYDIVCMVTPDVSEGAVSKLKVVFDYVQVVEYITAETKMMRTKKIEDRYGSWKSVSYTKWNVLQMTRYKKVLFMDADLIVVGNIDSLFKLQAPAATFSLAQAHPYSKQGLHNPYIRYTHGDIIHPDDIKLGFNLFVCIGTTVLIQPNMEHFNSYKQMIAKMQPFGFEKCVNGPDEQSIAWFYHSSKIQWTHIHQAFNMIPWKEKQWLSKKDKYFNKSLVLHYVCGKKPWELDRTEWEDLENWWIIAEDIEKCYPELQGFYII